MNCTVASGWTKERDSQTGAATAAWWSEAKRRAIEYVGQTWSAANATRPVTEKHAGKAKAPKRSERAVCRGWPPGTDDGRPEGGEDE